MVYDTFAKEMVLEPTGIVKAKKPERRDTYEGMKRVELHLHTNMSAMDGMSSTASLLCRAAKWGHRAMAITDHGVAQAFPEALHAQEGKQKDTIGDMKIIYGIEAYYINDENSISVVRGRSAEPLDGTFIVFDLETTGLNPASEEITEIAAVRVVEGEIRDSFQTYVNPHKPIPAEITELTGISDETVADAPGPRQSRAGIPRMGRRGTVPARGAQRWLRYGLPADGLPETGYRAGVYKH